MGNSSLAFTPGAVRLRACLTSNCGANISKPLSRPRSLAQVTGPWVCNVRANASSMSKNLLRATSSLLITGSLLLGGCSAKRPPTAWKNGDRSLVLALAVLAENDDGTPKPLPGQLGILTRQNGQWTHRTLEDADNNVFHKAMAYGSEGLLTLGGTKAVVKLWRTNGVRELLW